MQNQAFIDEVDALHRYLSDWLTGAVPRGSGVPERLADALAEDFVVIHPDGRTGSRRGALRAFGRAWNEKPSGYALCVETIRTRMLSDDTCLATYEEWHRGEPGRARVATAALRRVADGRIEWLLLQETPAPCVDAARNK